MIYFFPVILCNFDKNKRCHMSLLKFGHKCMVTKEAAVRRCSVERLSWKSSENSHENVGDEDWAALKKAI